MLQHSFFPSKIKMQIYNALFSAHVNFCTIVWGTTTQRNLRRILLLQKKALRCAANVSYTHPTKEFFLRYQVINATFMYQ